MMRCLACDVELTDLEATRKYAGSGDFVDLCDHCFETIEEDVDVIELPKEDWEEIIEEETQSDTSVGEVRKENG